MEKKYFFEDITLLITHYNRTSSLERLLSKFDTLKCSFREVIVSDDCSVVLHLEKLKKLSEIYRFKLLTSAVNRGLANNINKGQDEVRTPFTLYVQEDFIPEDIFPEKLNVAVQALGERPDIDMVRFYAYFKYPYLKPYKGGFSEMTFKYLSMDYNKFYYYSDHPHLRRDNFTAKFGKYVEGIKSDRAEYKMMFSFLKAKGKALYYDDYQGLFEQKNDSAEPSTIKRNFLRESSNSLIAGIRHLYRFIRFNIDLLRS